MELITGITGGASAPEEELLSEREVRPESTPTVEEAPERTIEERSYSLVGRALRFVMRTVTPGAWQSVVQKMAGHLPARIELVSAPDKPWNDDARHWQLVEELHDQGFVDAGVYRAASMEMLLHLMVNEAYDIRAVLYESATSGVVLDLVTLFGDGTGITYVNREDPGYEQSPLHPNIYLGAVPVFEQLDTCLRDRPKKARLPEQPSTAARLMELEYEFGAKRLRGEPVNPVEIADAYLEVIERAGARRSAEPNEWTGRAAAILPENPVGLTTVEKKSKAVSAKS